MSDPLQATIRLTLHTALDPILEALPADLDLHALHMTVAAALLDVLAVHLAIGLDALPPSADPGLARAQELAQVLAYVTQAVARERHVLAQVKAETATAPRRH
jgi:hypothetical protein